jgi:thioredoxin-like negative regulator of GroEL/GTPase SAR1 family protein
VFDDADRALRWLDGTTALARYEALEADGFDARARAGGVRALWLLRRWDEARKLLATASRVESVHLSVARGVLALGQPDWPAWINVYESSALRDDTAAVAAFAEATRLDPCCAEAVAGHAMALRMSGRTVEAQQILAEVEPGLRTSEPVLVELAVSALERDDFQAASGFALRALDKTPDSVRAELAYLTAEMNLKLGQQEVVDLFRTSLDRWQAPPAPLRELLGQALAERASLFAADERDALIREALSELTHATEPELASLHSAVWCYLDSGIMNQVMALTHVEHVRAANPNSPAVLLTWAALVGRESGHLHAALDVYRQVLDQDPRSLAGRLNLSAEFVKLNRLREAETVLAQLSKELPGNNEVAGARSRLEALWTMPTESAETRITAPWLDGSDSPGAVLKLLTEEVVERLYMLPDEANRLRHRITSDPDSVLRSSTAGEQHYLRMRDGTQPVRRAWFRRTLYSTGQLLSRLASVALIVAWAVLAWLLSDLVDLTDGWRVVITAAVTATALSAVWRLVFGKGVIDIDRHSTFVTSAGLLGLAVWQGIVLFDLWLGLLAGLGSFFAWEIALIGGWSLALEFSKVNTFRTQMAFDWWVERIYGYGILPAALEAISSQDSYSVWLSPRCRVVSGAPAEIETEAARELQRLLSQRSKGSFALAGPRGAGKSTLLERWCAGEFLRQHSDWLVARGDLSIRVDAPVGYDSKDFLVHLFGRLCDAVDEDVVLADRWWRVRRSAPSVLAQRAQRERERLRFLRTWTREREGSLVGGPVTLRGKFSLQQNDIPLTYPELVAGFRDFLEAVAREVAQRNGKVLIGIDELDRITDGENAQRFLNELKAVFNVPNCFFLVAVSEDALADFELSVMGMRTVFDSAFDAIVRVDYLRFDEAKVLLRRRAMDLPEQFGALVYVLSGGLARELARTVEVIGTRQTPEKQDLASVTAFLVRRQTYRTTRAAMDRLGRLAPGLAGARLIPVLDEHLADHLTGDWLRDYAARIAAEGEGDVVEDIRLDVVVMVEYLATLLDVFDNRLSEERMRTGLVRGPGDFETLAKVRRYLGANPYGAQELLKSFRKSWGTVP